VRLLVAGSIALDTLEGPFGRVTGELGGSALYFARPGWGRRRFGRGG